MNPADQNNDPNAVPPVQPEAPAPQPTFATPAPEYQQPGTPEVQAPTPVAEPVPAPVFDQSPAAPTAYETPVEQPVAPIAPQSTGPIIGSGPEIAGGAAPLAAKKSNKKLIILIAAIVGGLALIGGGIFLAISLLANNLPLKEYQGETYTILVPETYIETIEGPTASFSLYEPKDETTKYKNSVVTVSSTEYNEFLTKESWMKLIDENFTKERIEEAGDKTSSSVAEGYTYENVTLRSEKLSGSETRGYTADVLKDGTVVGKLYSAYVFGNDNMYIVAILARQDSPGFAASAEKIFTSFTAK